MSAHHESPAVAIAQAHVEAWSNHDFDAARRSLAPGVQVTSTTTQPIMKDVRTTGIDDYMSGLIAFAQGVVPGTARVLASTGDERNALLLVTLEADLGGGKMELPGARLYLLDEDGKIASEQVIFYAAAN
jgi:hypothetical protein